ncbi:MAG: beta-lactamase family protein [Roseiflexaceae bacterium]|nr:beta-lactamase family protein [Roseiflexaceae bacterium]
MFTKAPLLFLAAMITVATAIGTVAQPAARAPDFAAIDAYIKTEMNDDRVPGVALAIVQNDQIAYLRGYGDDGYGRPVTPQTSFILGSMSKSFTALAIMQLVERGEIELDAPVQRYLAWFRVADPAASAALTMRHLLNHTSGIPTHAPQASGNSVTLQDHVRVLADVSLNNWPGAKHEYASPNYLVLGAVIEQITGLSYAAYIQQHVFAPLQMQHSFTEQNRAIQNGMAQGHRYWFGFPVAATLEYEDGRMPTAALISSAEDLGQYLIALLNTGRYGESSVLSPTSIAQMYQSSVPSEGFSYAFGWRVGTIGDVPAIHHGGIVPHFRGKMVMLPEQRWGVVVLTNASTSFPLPILPTSHRLADAIAANLAGQSLVDSSYTQSIIYLAITIGMALILFSQIAGLLQVGRWRAQLSSRPRWRVLGEVAVELLWPLFALIGLPRVIGIPWSELLRGTPDMAWWLIASVVLGLLTCAVKVIAIRQRPGGGTAARTP